MLALWATPQVETSQTEFQALRAGVLFAIALAWALAVPTLWAPTLRLGRELIAIIPTTAVRAVARGDTASVHSLLLLLLQSRRSPVATVLLVCVWVVLWTVVPLVAST